MDGIAITDHNSVANLKRAKRYAADKDIIFVPGVELHTEKGHLLALGIEQLPGTEILEEALDIITEMGGISVAPHPFSITRGGIGKAKLLQRVDAMEVINYKTYPRFNRRAKRYAIRNNITQLASTDSHMLFGIGKVWTEIEADSVEALLKKVKAGQTEITCKRPSNTAVSLIKFLQDINYRYRCKLHDR